MALLMVFLLILLGARKGNRAKAFTLHHLLDISENVHNVGAAMISSEEEERNQSVVCYGKTVLAVVNRAEHRIQRFIIMKD